MSEPAVYSLAALSIRTAHWAGTLTNCCSAKRVISVAHTSQLSGLGRSVWQQDEFG